MMKKLTLVLSIILLIGFSASAQLDKSEKKEWKAKYKAYKKDLEGFKDIVEENDILKSRLTTAKKQLSAMQSQISDRDSKLAENRDEISKLQGQISSAKAAEMEARNALANAAANTAAVPVSPMSLDGVVFKVQIGAFEKNDLSKYFENNPNFTGESEGGLQKVSIGFFRDYWEADTFKKHIREMGVKDAWIVPFKDGVRVAIKDVLEGII